MYFVMRFENILLAICQNDFYFFVGQIISLDNR